MAKQKAKTETQELDKKVLSQIELTLKLFTFLAALLSSIKKAHNETTKITSFIDFAKVIEPVKKEFPSFVETDYLSKEQFDNLDDDHQYDLVKPFMECGLFNGDNIKDFSGFMNDLFDWLVLTNKLLSA